MNPFVVKKKNPSDIKKLNRINEIQIQKACKRPYHKILRFFSKRTMSIF